MAFFVAGVAAMFADEHDAVDGELGGAGGEGFGDGGIDLHAGEASGAVGGEVAVGTLVNVEGDEVHIGMVVFAVPAVAFEEAVDDVLAVGVFAVLCDDCGDFGTAGGPRKGGGGEEFAAGKLH